MDANKTYWEKARWKLYNNATSYFELRMETTAYKTTTVRPLAPISKTIQVRRTKYAEYFWRSHDELIRDVLLWTPTHGRASVIRPARTCLHHLCADIGCRWDNFPEVMDDRDREREREREREYQGKSLLTVQLDEDVDIYIYIYIYIEI